MSKVFLLGAGFSTDISQGRTPDTNRISEAIIELLDKNTISKYGFEKDDFEIALTRLDLETSPNITFFKSLERKNKEQEFNEKLEKYHGHTLRLSEIKKKIIFKIAELFRLNDADISTTNAGTLFAEKLLKKDDIIITTNYDTYLENLLGPEKWSYHGGYGEVMNWRLANDPHEKKKMNIRIYKIHGCPAFRKIEMSIYENDIYRKGDVRLSITKEYFPKFYSNLGNVSDEGPYLILPSFIKGIEFAAMSDLYREVLSVVRDKNHLVIIGSRLRKEDYMLWLTLSYFRSSPEIKIDIVDPDAISLKEKIVETLRIPEEDINTLVGTLSEKINDLLSLASA